MGKPRKALAFLACSPALLAAAAPAHAAFPGGNGKIVFDSYRDGSNPEIYAMNADGSAQMRLTTNAEHDDEPAWSPDGERIAFLRVEFPDINPEIYVMNADGSGETNLTNHPSGDYDPSWSPDGERIAFLSRRDADSGPGIYAMNADGSGQTKLTSNADDNDPAWSPDGHRIAFTRYDPQDGLAEIYAMNADGSGETRLTKRAIEPTWSPDGQRIAFSKNDEIHAMDADGSGETRLTSNGFVDHHPAWSPDGERLAFASYRHSNFGEIYAMDANGCGQTNLTGNTADDLDPDWQAVPDGTALALPPADCNRTLSVSYAKKKDKFEGRLRAESPACPTSEQKVSIYEKQRQDKGARLGSDRTKASGKYSLMETNAKGRFYAQVKQTSTASETCLAATSKTIKVG